MNVIKGNAAPKAEEKTFYEVGNGLFSGSQSLFLTEEKEAIYTWTLFKSQGGNWVQVEGNIKHGKKVPYTFGEKVVGIPYKIVVNSEGKNLFNQLESKFFASILVTPRTAKEPSIGRVILLNRGKQNVNKATFNESLSAQARTANLVGKEITFYLWEEGASEDDKYRKPKKARVNKNGIAEVKFNLIEYASQPLLMQIFNFNSKTTKKFFVTAVYKDKKITNKGAVEASEADSTASKKEGSDGILSKGSEVLGEGWKNIVDAVEKALTATRVGKTPVQNNKPCVCKEEFKDLYWGEKVSCAFRQKVVAIAKRLDKDPNLIMAGMALETGKTFSPTAGKGSSYVGLIQFGDDAAESVGTTRSKLLQMTATDQLDYVEEYLIKKKDKLNTLTDFYLSILMPVDVGKGKKPDFAVFDNKYPLEYNKKGKLTDLSKSRHYGYRQNPTFFHENGEKEMVKKGGGKKYDGEGKTYIWEIEKSIKYYYDEGKLNKVKVFQCDKTEKVPITPTLEKGKWSVIITEHFTGTKCAHIEKTPIRSNCRRGTIEVYDHNGGLVLTISDCLLEGIAGEDRMVKDSDAPFGTYQISSEPFIMGSSSGDKRTSYGPNPRLSFEPIPGGGDEAAKSGRSLIRIHGGRQETKKFSPRPNPTLLRTHGCIRIWDADAKRFYDWWVDYHKSNPNIKPGKLKIIK